jgi:lysophospholipase L1-like esterase
MAALRELFLKPGRKLSFADVPPATMAKITEAGRIDAERAKKDWANLCKFAAKNRAVLASGKVPRVVFLGDSITENWEPADPTFFTIDTIDRGIGGQTTSQLLLRVYADVVALRPRIVHIMAGTNDVAGNTGPVSDDTIVDNIRAMIDIAQVNHTEVVLASIPPSSVFFWNPAVKPAARIRALNLRLRDLAAERGAVWVDYYAKLASVDGGLPDALANDGVHPNRAGYALMRPLAEAAVSRADRKASNRSKGD